MAGKESMETAGTGLETKKGQKKLSRYQKALSERRSIDVWEDEVWRPKAGTPKGDSSMERWYPVVSSLVSTPVTVKVMVPDRCNVFRLLDTLTPLRWDIFFSRLSEAVQQLRLSLPAKPAVYLRTSCKSAAFYWRESCFLDSFEDKDIKAHVKQIAQYCALEDYPVDCFWVQEFIETAPAFYAFGGRPISREYRLRVNKGKVVHVQPYWRMESFLNEAGLVDYWLDKLHGIWRIGRGELNRLVSMTEKIGQTLGKDWSVDWLQAADGTWYCVDVKASSLSHWWDARPEDFIVEDGSCSGSAEQSSFTG